jgi:hypothetical protein
MDALKNQLTERFDLMNAAGSESSENESSELKKEQAITPKAIDYAAVVTF